MDSSKQKKSQLWFNNKYSDSKTIILDNIVGPDILCVWPENQWGGQSGSKGHSPKKLEE